MADDQEQARQRLADSARTMADLAEETADLLDEAAERSHGERRRATAAWEREVARAERHNADEYASGKPAGERDLVPIPNRPPEVARAAQERDR